MAPENPMSKYETDFSDVHDGFSKLTLRKKNLLTSTQPSAAELQDKLSDLKDEISKPDTKASDLSLAEDFLARSDGASTGNDSGYASLVSTPHTDNEKPDCPRFTSSQFQTPKLKSFDMAISEELRGRFFDLKLLYSKPLWKAVSKRKANPGDISMKLRYMGETETTARLYIVINCEKEVAKRAKRFFAQDHVLEDLKPHFQVHIVHTGLLRLSTPSNIDVYRDSVTRNTFCGMPIQMQDDDASAVATLGGLIVAWTLSRPTIYGITAGHPLTHIYQNSNNSPSPQDQDDSHSDSESDSGMSEDDGSIQLPEPDVVELGDETTASFMGPNKKPFGHIFADSLHSSSADGNRDWALVCISPEGMPMSLDLALQHQQQIEPSQLPEKTPVDKPVSRTLFYNSLQRTRLNDSVVIMTSRGFQRGTLLANGSSILIAPGTTFVEALDFVPSTGSALKPGDSGSWAINENTGEVYGHVVSVDAFGEAYVMPIQDTLEDIHHHLEADRVELPDKELAWYNQRKLDLDPLSEAMTTAPLPDLAGSSSLPEASMEPVVITRREQAPAAWWPSEIGVDYASPSPHSKVPSLTDSFGTASFDRPPEGHAFDKQQMVFSPEPLSKSDKSTIKTQKGKGKGMRRKLLRSVTRIFRSGKEKTKSTQQHHIESQPGIPSIIPLVPEQLSSPYVSQVANIQQMQEYYHQSVYHSAHKHPMDSGYATMESSAAPSPNTSPLAAVSIYQGGESSTTNVRRDGGEGWIGQETPSNLVFLERVAGFDSV